MKVQLKNLGVISEGVIDLNKKINVFCGPNGTGKTYAAFAIYGLIKNVSFGVELKDDYIKKIITEDKAEIDLDFNKIWDFKEKQTERLNNNLWNIFAVSQKDREKYFNETKVSIIESKEEFFDKLNKLEICKYELKVYGYSFEINKQVGNQINVLTSSLNNKDDRFKRFLEIILLSKLYSLLAFYPTSSTTILPVERNSVYTFSKELSIRKNEALEHLQALKSDNQLNLIDSFLKRSARYPQPVRDALEVAEDLKTISKLNSPYYQFAKEIEEDLLKGKIIISDEGNVEFESNNFRRPKLSFSFHQSSSIVKTLASLVVYLKHIATKNDLIIIDEPELNLHPDNQILLTRIFAKLINEGLRLIISTHSSHIIRELNNLIIIAEGNDDVKDLAQKKGYGDKERISLSDIGAYLFDYKKSGKKTVLRKIEIEKIKIDDTGFDVSTIDESIEKQVNIMEDLLTVKKYGKQDE